MPNPRSKHWRHPIISSGGVLFRERTSQGDWEYLLLKHSRGSFWDFPKGRRERGENDLQTAKREICEETGCKPPHLKILRRLKFVIRYSVQRGKLLLNKEVRLFLVRVSRDFQVELSEEHLNFEWMTYEEALKRITHNSSKKSLIEAHSWIQENSKLLFKDNNNETPLSTLQPASNND